MADNAGARLITDYFRELERGEFLNDSSTALQNLVSKIVETGKSGKMTITLDIKPHSHDAETVNVAASFKVNEPSLPRIATLFFVTDEHNLSRRDSRQGDIEKHIHEVHTADDAAE